MRIGYARVSTAEQSLNLQLDALALARCDMVFDDRISGKSRKRTGLDMALSKLKSGDQLVVWRLDRLGRNFGHLVEIADMLRARGANLVSLTEGIDTSSNVGEVIFRLLSVFSDFERNVIVERTVAGLQSARRRGVVLGRRRKMTNAQVIEAKSLMASGMKAEIVATRYGVARSTLFRSVSPTTR
jgi:DNA invertase Pin-like site-specific DNA recombinase